MSTSESENSEHVRRRLPKYGFGMSPISERMHKRYEYAVKSVLGLLDGEISSHEIDVNSISELKGMFNRCLRQDQWDWFSIYELFGAPPNKQMRVVVGELVEFRQAVTDGNDAGAEIIRQRLANSPLKMFLQNFLEGKKHHSSDNGEGWIYVLSTREAPDYLKIGMTSRSVALRVKEINSATGVLFPYSVRGMIRVTNAADAERAVFDALNEYRMRGDREFFEIPFHRAMKVIRESLANSRLIQRSCGTIK